MPNPFFSPSILSSLSIGDDSYGSPALPKHRSLADIEAEAAKTPPADTSWHPLDAVKKGWNSLQAAEDKYITPITTKVDQATTDVAQKVGQGLKETMLPTDRWSDVIEGPKQVIKHPIDSAKLVGSSLWDAQKAQFDKAKTDPTISEKIGHYAAGALPIVGPMAAQAGETIGKGEFARGAGQVAGILGPMALGAKGASARAAEAADAARATEAARVRTGALKPPGIREKLGLQPVDPVGPVQGPQPPTLGPEPPMLGPVPPPKPKVVKAAPAVPPVDPNAIGPVGPVTSKTQPITPAPQATRAPAPAAPNFRRVKTAGPLPEYRLGNDELNPKLDGTTVRQLRAAGFPDADISEMGKSEAAYHIKNGTQGAPSPGPIAPQGSAPIGNVDPIASPLEKLAVSVEKDKARRAAAPVPEVPEEEAPVPPSGIETRQTSKGPMTSPIVKPMGTPGRLYAGLSDQDLALLAKIDDPAALKEIGIRQGAAAPEPPKPGGAGPFVGGEPADKPVLPSETPVPEQAPSSRTGLLDQIKNAYNKSKLSSERGSIQLAPDPAEPPPAAAPPQAPPAAPGNRDFYAPSEKPGVIRRNFHGSINPEFDAKFADWVNSRKAARAEGANRQKSFADMDALGTDGIDAFTRGLDQGRFKDVHDYFKAKEIQLNSLGVDTKKGSFEQLLKDYESSIETDGKKAPKFGNIGQMLGHYEGRVNRAIADHQFLNYLKDNGHVMPEGKAPLGWETLSQEKHFPVEKFRQKKTGEVYTKNLQASPQVAEAINNYLNPSNKLWNLLARGTGFSKNVTLSAGLAGTGVNAHGANILARNAMTRGLLRGGAEGMKYLINTGADNPISKGIEKIAPWESARQLLESNRKDIPDAIKHGLTMSTEEHELGQTGGSAHMVSVGDARPTAGKTAIGRGINKAVGVAGKATDKLVETQGKYFEDPLFQNTVPALKMKHWKNLTADMMKAGLDETTAKKNAAHATNEAYGGINWEAMQRSRSWQDAARTFLLAPDWLETQYRMGKGWKNTLMDPKNPQGLMYKRSMVNIASAYMAANAANKTMSGHYMWDNEPGHGLDIEAGEVGGKTRYIRPFGTAADFARLPLDAAMGIAKGDMSAPLKIAKNRLSTTVRPAADLIMNVDPFGNPIGGPDKFGRPQPLSRQIGQYGREVGSAVLPQYIKGPLDLATGRAGSVEEAALGSLEAPVRYSRKSTRPVSRHPPTPRAPRQSQAPQ